MTSTREKIAKLSAQWQKRVAQNPKLAELSLEEKPVIEGTVRPINEAEVRTNNKVD
jgi:hypothetical protein